MIDHRQYTPEQYRNSARMNAVLDGTGASLSIVEEAADELRGLMNPDLCEGAQLDRIGGWKDMPRRSGEGDEAYRERIKTGHLPLPSLKAVRAAVKDITGSENVGLYPDWPAGIYIVDYDAPDLTALSDARQELVAAGVDAQLGTFLCDEDDYGFIVDEATEMPIVTDIEVR